MGVNINNWNLNYTKSKSWPERILSAGIYFKFSMNSLRSRSRQGQKKIKIKRLNERDTYLIHFPIHDYVEVQARERDLVICARQIVCRLFSLLFTVIPLLGLCFSQPQAPEYIHILDMFCGLVTYQHFAYLFKLKLLIFEFRDLLSTLFSPPQLLLLTCLLLNLALQSAWLSNHPELTPARDNEISHIYHLSPQIVLAPSPLLWGV